MIFFVSLVICQSAFDIQEIVDRNPFDPNRGKVTTIEVTPTKETPPDPEAPLPQLDGVLQFDSLKIALLRGKVKGFEVAYKIDFDTQAGEYDLTIRRIQKAKKPQPKTRTKHLNRRARRNRISRSKPKPPPVEIPRVQEIPNGTILGYSVAEVTGSSVLLEDDRGEQRELKMFQPGSGKERGGTKKTLSGRRQ